MHTQLLNRLNIDESKLLIDIRRSADLQYSEHYTEFLCGRAWKSCMLWAPGGNVGDNIITHYDMDQVSSITQNGKQLPYVHRLMEDAFALNHLVFARLAIMSSSVGIPHRDYLEFAVVPKPKRAACRLHVPLVTNDDCYFSEDNIVFRMRFGEAWFLDVSRIHSSAVLSDFQRIHLILDFSEAADLGELVNFSIVTPSRIPKCAICPREPLSARERQDLLALVPVIDLDNLRDVFGLVIKKHYRKDGGENFVWNTFNEIASKSRDESVCKQIRELHKYYTLERLKG